MKNLFFLMFSLMLLGACASHKKDSPGLSVPQAKQETWQPNLKQVPEITSVDLGEDEHVSATSDTGESQKNDVFPVKAPVIGVWVEGAGLESFLALGFMQELHRTGLRWKKTVGTGWGCWIALSWAFEDSPNQSEWQAFKWSSWPGMGMDKRLLSRITGSRPSYEDFSKELKVWLNKNEYREYVGNVDCPLLDTKNSTLVSSRDYGAYRSLWEQLQIPLYGRLLDSDVNSPQRLSGLAAPQVHDGEYDLFSNLSDGEEVEFWIHLHSSPAQIISTNDPWLKSIYSREELRGNAWEQTQSGRWILHVPLFLNSSINSQKSLNFSERRAMMLRGRQLAKQWIGTQWFQNNLAHLFKE